MTTLLRAAPVLAGAAVLIVPPVAFAASCREELDRFERALNASSLAATQPDTYAELARAAEEASELRDEAVCMERVAQLEAELAAAAPENDTARRGAAPPEPPALLESAPDSTR